MNLKQFLLEAANRVEYAAKTYKDKLMAAQEKDSHGKKFKDAQELAQFLADKISETHIVWLCKMYSAGQFKQEDAGRIKGDIELFNKVRNKLENKDLNSYKTVSALYDVLEPFENADAEDLMSNKEKVKAVKSDVKYLIDTDNFKAMVPKTEAAACFYGANTKWCTAAKDNNMFEHYSKDGDLIIIIAKDPKTGKDRKFQLHYESSQFMDEKDSEVGGKDITFLSSFPQYADLLNMLIDKHYVPFFEDELKK